MEILFRSFFLVVRSLLPLSFMFIHCCCFSQKIDRKSVVGRNKVILKNIDTLGSLTVGNGKFAFTVDATGFQSFPEYYAKGVPLGTQSEWGWHSFPNKEEYQYAETLKAYNFNKGQEGLYAVQQKTGRGKEASDYFRENPHRLQLGNIGFEILKKDGSKAKPADLTQIHQELNLWTGEISSSFSVEGHRVKVITCADAIKDMIAVKVTSDLIKLQRIKIKFRFPYPTNKFADMGVNYSQTTAHQTKLSGVSAQAALLTHKLDHMAYYMALGWRGRAKLKQVAAHEYELLPAAVNTFSASIEFSPSKPVKTVSTFEVVDKNSIKGWLKFWESGAAVDFAGSTDSRAPELERRVILSQYLLRVQEAGNYPPQETGLTYNSWYGRPHLEMLWWHAAQYAFWGRADLMERSMQWYFKAFEGAKAIAQRQGYNGVRWQKMSDNDGAESPSNVGSFLIWQQPNIIYEAELLYRDKPSKALLQKYQKLIFATADFMAAFASYDAEKGRYNLGKGIIPAQECFNMSDTFNSPYELAYWKWALQVAQRWRTRLGLNANKNWQAVIDQLAPLAQADGLYKAAESVDDSYSSESKYTIDHPAVLQTLSALPQNGMVDTAMMHRTFNTVKKVWHWEHTWGWDFPMVAMAATRLNLPDDAVDVLFKEVTTNTYLKNGHNYQTPRLTIYLPGNGSLLSAIAIMCAGYDGNKISNPGFPKNGKWKVKWEGFKPLP